MNQAKDAWGYKGILEGCHAVCEASATAISRLLMFTAGFKSD